MGSRIRRRRLRSLIDRDGAKCAACGRPVDYNRLTMDHIYPRSKGGCDCRANLQLLCQPCNVRKDDKIGQGGHRRFECLTGKFYQHVDGRGHV